MNNMRGIALAERENVQLYIQGCIKVGDPSHETFSVGDLYDAKYLSAVLTNLAALSRVAQVKGVDAPVYGVRVKVYKTSNNNNNSPKWGIVSNQNYKRGL